jgi:F5/8 type C domain
MRKRVIHQETQGTPADDQDWLDLEQRVQAELTSEDAAHPIEAALGMQTGSGWRAQHPGKQTIRLLFDEPHRISRIRLVFEENDRARTQEFVLRWSPDGGSSWEEIVRQQYNFSPPDSCSEVEDYLVDIDGLTLLELDIIPDISGGDTRASLARLRLA